ncbi:MAG: hypothetical protein WA152_02460 [Microgenomates group bacterium]
MSRNKTSIQKNRKFLITSKLNSIILLSSILILVIIYLTTSTKKYSNNYCGNNISRVNFSVNIPTLSIVETESNDQDWASYSFRSLGQNLYIICGQGFGGDCPTANKTEYVFSSQRTNGCYVDGINYLSVYKQNVHFLVQSKSTKIKFQQLLLNLDIGD